MALSQRLVALLSLFSLLALTAGCGTGPDDDPTIFYQFTMTAFASDTTSERVRSHECFVYGSFGVSRPLPPSGTAQLQNLTVNRRLTEASGTHYETTYADSAITDATLQFTGLSGDSLSLTLNAGSYVTTLGPGGFSAWQGGFEGPWTCDAGVPLAQDSTLSAWGYDPNLAIQGNWRVSEIYPID